MKMNALPATVSAEDTLDWLTMSSWVTPVSPPQIDVVGSLDPVFRGAVCVTSGRVQYNAFL